MKTKELIKKIQRSFWISFFLTISTSLLAVLLGASTLWAVIAGLVFANLVNVCLLLRKPKEDS